MNARVREIYFGSEREGPMKFATTVRAIAGKGLDGDRYALGTGSYSKSKGIRDVTLIEIEAVWEFLQSWGIDLHPSLLRRNIVTEGARLSDLIGSAFSIGSVSLLGLRPCPPCHHLTKIIGVPEVLGGLAHSGGIYAQILSDGIISIDDPVIQHVLAPPVRFFDEAPITARHWQSEAQDDAATRTSKRTTRRAQRFKPAKHGELKHNSYRVLT